MDFSFTEDQNAIRDMANQLFGDRASDRGAGSRELRCLFGRAVINGKLVTGIENITGHGLAHAAQSDESNLHVTFLRLRLEPVS